jgi:hypothetical protein
VESYQRSSRPDWPWFESRITYANAVLPHALFAAAERWPAEAFGEVASASFDFLDRITTDETGESTGKSTDKLVFSPIGSNGWYSHGESKATYDQQPVEAATMAEAAIAVFRLCGDERHLAIFRRARDWFHGGNSLEQPLADSRSGACCDGLHPLRVNRNQGAESTLAHLWVELQAAELRSELGQRDVGVTASA